MSKLKAIIDFIEDFSGLTKLKPDSDILMLGVYGDDFHELIQRYAEEFEVDVSQYKWYFHGDEEGLNFGSLLFKAPYERVERIPVTPQLLADFAEKKRWNCLYPEHTIPERRYDLLINKVILFGFLIFLVVVSMLSSCQPKKTGYEILQNTIQSIDTIETISLRQKTYRSHPKNMSDTLFRYREIVFKRLISDSLVGVKGHWYMYLNDTINIVYEDIYDGERLIRKNNRDSAARVYDLVEHPELKQQRFWGHNTPFAMQYELRYALAHPKHYQIKRRADTSMNNQPCYQVSILLSNHSTQPGFATSLEESMGSIMQTTLFIRKDDFYPLAQYVAFYSAHTPNDRSFFNQHYLDVKLNQNIDETTLFSTHESILKGYDVWEMED